MRKSLFMLLSFLIGQFTSLEAQIELITKVSADTVCAGNTVNLSAKLSYYTFHDSLTNSYSSSFWAGTSPMFYSNPCSPGPAGPYAWTIPNTILPRHFTSKSIPFFPGEINISWKMKYGIDENSTVCEEPDDINEGVHLQYSNLPTGGFLDFPVANVDPIGPNSINPPFITTVPGSGSYWAPKATRSERLNSSLYYWHDYETTMTIPSNYSSFYFRFAQLYVTSNTYDTWGIDEITVRLFDNQALFSWSTGHSGSQASNILLKPHPLNIMYDTCFYVVGWSQNFPNVILDTTICVTVLPVPTSTIVMSENEICAGDSITLTAYTNPGMDFRWEINGQNFGNTSPINVSFPEGNYNAKLYVSNSICDTAVSQSSFTVHPMPNPDFSVNSIIGCAPLIVQFNNLTQSQVSQYQWYMGDGSVSNAINPSHTYLNEGQFSVRLKAVSVNGLCSNTKIYNDLISVPCGAPCSLSTTILHQGSDTICIGDSTMLSSSLINTNYSYQWLLNGGIIPGANAPTFYAKNEGVYNVKVSDSCTTFSADYQIFEFPSINPHIVALSPYNCIFDSLKLLLPTTYNTYYWSTGNTSSELWVNQSGNYYVHVTDDYGCELKSAPFDYINYSTNSPSICYVTFDNDLEKNTLVWNKDFLNFLVDYNIYRSDNQNTQVILVDSLIDPLLNKYLDISSDPKFFVYNYQILANDKCFNSTPMSQPISSTKLHVNSDLNNKWILSWNLTNLPTSTYYLIYRGTTKANLQLVDSVPASQNIYHDL
ncbi:MAG: PKD domain-containing protein, partial [Bacteroidales bacterium]|nr:PKD domain-containing protein [Bacteroidales bacterium]